MVQVWKPAGSRRMVTKLYNKLQNIQYGDEADQYGWVKFLED